MYLTWFFISTISRSFVGLGHRSKFTVSRGKKSQEENKILFGYSYMLPGDTKADLNLKL